MKWETITTTTTNQSEDERLRELNIAKDQTLSALYQDGFLTEEEAYALKFHYHVSLVKPSLITSLYKKFFDNSKGSKYFAVSRLYNTKSFSSDIPDFPARKKGELKILKTGEE